MRSRKISAPRGTKTRPSTDRVRESMFNLIDSRMELYGARVLDLFAGSGALGFEAISRGARHVTFVESDYEAIRTIRQNAKTLGVEELIAVLGADVPAFLGRHSGDGFDLILADPPYRYPRLPEIVTSALGIVSEAGLLVLEHATKKLPDELEGRVICSRRYGRTLVTIFQ